MTFLFVLLNYKSADQSNLDLKSTELPFLLVGADFGGFQVDLHEFEKLAASALQIHENQNTVSCIFHDTQGHTGNIGIS